ncbi:MAG TPA: energy-coupling factor transporter transmembrane protein EcfT [Rectinemataceae bacterium]|nr:energy-coupling factor transporter transmembrane protein EcfT [Rectinemataceae bacterium]
MRDLEFFRNVSIGQYVDTGSAIHRMSPATKYLWLLALAIPAMASPGYAGALSPLLAALGRAAAARVSPGFLLRGLKPVVPLFAVVAVMQVLFGWPGDRSAVLFRAGPIAATAREAHIVLMAVARTVSLVVVVGLFTSVTTEGEAAHGIEDFLAPFARLGFPAHAFALAATTALRFIPIIAGELESIVKAQAARGADFGSGRGGLLAKARAYLPLFVPVMIRALERAEALAEAMEARCYSGYSRTRYVVYEKLGGEWAARLLAPLFCAAVFILDSALSAPLAALLGAIS